MKKLHVKAIVINNVDPVKTGRVQIRIPSLHDGVFDEDLPWAIPTSMSIGHGSLDIPTIGKEVFVDITDPQEPQYTGNSVDPDSVPSQLQTNYPDRKGFVDQHGNVFYRDVGNGDIFLSTPSGTNVTIDPSGRVNVTSAVEIILNCGSSSVTITPSSVTVSSPSTINLAAPTVSMSGAGGGGTISMNSGGDIRANSSSEIQMQCGSSSIQMTPNELNIRSPNVTSNRIRQV